MVNTLIAVPLKTNNSDGKEKSNSWAWMKYLYVLPLAAIVVAAFARSEVSSELKEISKVKVGILWLM